MTCQSTGNAARVVLEGVPRVNFYSGGPRCPEDVPFPACLKACLEYMGDALGCRGVAVRGDQWQVGCGYAYLMGATGAAFRLAWTPGTWEPANSDLMAMHDDPLAPFQRAFDAIGYTYALHLKDHADSEAMFRDCILTAITDQKRPVLALGVVGPPECCIITGFDDHGDTLIGWSFFQNLPEHAADLEFEPSGCFRKRAWFADTEGLILIGEKGVRPHPKEVYRRALAWALELARTPRVGPRSAGFAAYEAWAAALLKDEEFPHGDMDTLRMRHVAHNDAVSTVAEGRWYGAQFLKDAAKYLPECLAELLSGAAAYEREHDLMCKLWALQGGNGWSDAFVRNLADPEVRKESAALVRAARDEEARAIERIEKALAKLD